MFDYLGEYGDSILKNFNTKTKDISLQDWIIDRSKKRGYKALPVFVCKECQVTLIFDCNGLSVCPNCGLSSNYNFVDAYQRTPTPYKRLTHFKDWLTKSQAKHTVDFPKEFLPEIKKSFSPEKGLTPNYTSIRRYLKKRGLFKYYEDIALIIFHITGRCDFILTSTEEDQLCNHFNLITKVYNNYKNNKRKSIISYRFIIRDLITLLFPVSRQKTLNLDYFILPKTEKLLEYNLVFKKIKQFYGWGIAS